MCSTCLTTFAKTDEKKIGLDECGTLKFPAFSTLSSFESIAKRNEKNVFHLKQPKGVCYSNRNRAVRGARTHALQVEVRVLMLLSTIVGHFNGDAEMKSLCAMSIRVMDEPVMISRRLHR